MTAFLPLLAKDARILVRNRPLLVALLVYPLILAGTLAAAFQEPPATLDLAVWNGDEGGASIEAGGVALDSSSLVADASQYARVRNVTSEAEARALVRRGEVDAALLIPPGFVASFSTIGGNATLVVVVDESDTARAGVARNAVTGGIDAFLRSIVARKVADVEALLNITVTGGTTRILFVDFDVLGIEAATQRLQEVHATLDERSDEARKVQDVITFLQFARSVLGNAGGILRTTAMPVDLETRGLLAERTPLAAVALPGALALGVFWTGSLSAALLVARERETGAARRLAAAPGAQTASVLSKLLVAMLAALLPALLLVVVAVAWAGAIVRDPALAVAALVTASLAAAALGWLAAGLARATSAATLVAILLLVPMLLLGGLFYPVAYMPGPVQAVARALPVTAATDALRGAMLRGSGIADVALPLAGLIGFTLAAGAAGALLSRRT